MLEPKGRLDLGLVCRGVPHEKWMEERTHRGYIK